MTDLLFIRVLNMSLTGSFVILTVMAMRILLRKAPSIFSYCLWAVVLFRLLCPISFTAVFSPLNALRAPLTEHGSIEYISEDLLQYSPSDFPPGITEADSPTNLMAQSTAPAAAAQSPVSARFILRLAAGVWLAGILVMALHSIITLVRLMKKLSSASWERENVYITESISTPFVIGLIHPRIYLPSLLSKDERRYILLHEQIHLRRKDHIVKIISFAALCLHWFNPLVWAAFFLSGKDMEMSCDEAVIRRVGSGVKKEYTTSLLCLSTGKRIVNGIPLAFVEGDTGSRIRNVLRYKRPAAFVIGIAAAVCSLTAVILLANPQKPEKDGETGGSVTYYGVVMDINVDDAVRRLLVVPNFGEIEIPAAETIDTYFESGDERDPHTLLPGDLTAVTFSSKEAAAILETWPARFSAPAESITVMWQGLSLEEIGGSSDLLGSIYLLTFPGGIIPDSSTAEAGDILSLYWEETEDGAYLPQIPESGSSRLIASAPILDITGNESDGRMFTVGLNTSAAGNLLSGFGFHIRFALESGKTLTEEEQHIGEYAMDYLMRRRLQGQGSSAGSGEDEAERQLNGAVEGNAVTLPLEVHTVNIRSIARSARMIDSYAADDSFPYDSGEPLAFAENCVFKVNYSMDTVDYREVSFDDFAVLTESGPHILNKPCVLVLQDGLIVEADLQSAWFNYGISFDLFTPNEFLYDFLLEYEGESAFENFYSPASTESMDISDCEGNEIIEVYTGSTGDGDSGIVMFKNTKGELLCTDGAHVGRAGWNNIYLGEKDGVPFIMSVYVEDRWDYGGYGYWVYRLDEQGGIKQIAGSLFEFNLRNDLPEYDDDLFREWVGGMTPWLESSHLILSSQDGEIRTEKISEADKYNYDTLTLKDREL